VTTVLNYRQDAAKWQTVGIKLTHRPKSRFFAPRGRLVSPIHVELGRADGHVGPLGCAKFHLNRHHLGVNAAPNIKNFHFLVPWPIYQNFRGFYTPNYATFVFQIWRDSLHSLRSYCWETVHPSTRPNFSEHPVGKTMRWIQKWVRPSLMISTSSITMQSLGKIAQCGPAVGAKIWCFLFVFCHALCPEHSAFEGCIVWTSSALPFIARFRRRFHLFFTRNCSFTSTIVRIFVARWRHNFCEIAVKNCEKSKNRQKSLCLPLRIDSWRIWKI